MSAIKAVNWNRPDDDYSLMFWNQNIMQFWTDDEIPLSDDKMSWLTLSEIEKDSYMKVLGGLTLLDTIQGGVGMPQIMEHVNGLQRKAVLGFMGMMEQIHAKSYSSIFTTLASTEEIDGIFRWVEDNTFLQFKAETISEYYKKIESPKDLYLAMVRLCSTGELPVLQRLLLPALSGRPRQNDLQRRDHRSDPAR